MFLAYGFARTTMDDIARAVEISRPALYLIFRNKADIFRAVGRCFLNQSLEAARQALSTNAPLDSRLMKALDCALFKIFRVIEDSPHGAEILDMENHVAADILADWRRQLVEIFALAIEEEAAKRGVCLENQMLSAQVLAEMLFDLLGGLKVRRLRSSHVEKQIRHYITLIELALGGTQPRSQTG